jgi:hypothetical protein
VLGVRLVERSPLVRHRRAEETSRELVFEFLDPRPIGIAKEKPDHAVCENAIDKCVDNFAQFRLAAQFFEKRTRHDLLDARSSLIGLFRRAPFDWD